MARRPPLRACSCGPCPHPRLVRVDPRLLPAGGDASSSWVGAPAAVPHGIFSSDESTVGPRQGLCSESDERTDVEPQAPDSGASSGSEFDLQSSKRFGERKSAMVTWTKRSRNTSAVSSVTPSYAMRFFLSSLYDLTEPGAGHPTSYHALGPVDFRGG